MKLAAQQFLKAIRGPRSQVAFARRLGFKGNPIGDWESGRRTPTINEALRACDRVGIDVQGAFGRFQPSIAVDVFDPLSLARWLSALRGTTPIADVAARGGVSRYTVGRWLHGKAFPRVHEFLLLLEAVTGRASDLVAELVPIAQVPALAALHEARDAARRLAHEEPWTEAILRVLEARSYRPGSIADALAIDIETEHRCIEKLVHAGVVQRRGSRLEVAGELTVDTRAAARLKAHWAGVANERVLAPGDGDLFSYNVFSVASDDLAVIRELLRATYREIRAIVSNSQGTDAVALVNLQLVRWLDGGTPSASPKRGST
jgi:transcriptional regulator with XRE-family HTH domain